MAAAVLCMSLASCKPTFYPADLTVEIGDEDYDLVSQYREIEEISDRCIVSIIDSTVDSSKLGTYSVTFEIGNEKEVFQTVKCTVEVEDNTPPEVTVGNVPALYYWEDNSTDEAAEEIRQQLRSCISAYDAVDGAIDSSEIAITIPDDGTQLGSHRAGVYAKDLSGNETKGVSIDYTVTANPYKVIASGKTDGSGYRLIGAVEEDYKSAQVKLGIMKNSQWVCEPTAEMPFVKDGKVLGQKTASIPDEDSNSRFRYIGDHCFMLLYSEKSWDKQCVVYNCETGKTFSCEYDKVYLAKEETCINSDKVLAIKKDGSSLSDGCLYLLDTSNMVCKKVEGITSEDDFGFYSDGLICWKNRRLFLDKNGNTALDLSNDYNTMYQKDRGYGTGSIDKGLKVDWSNEYGIIYEKGDYSISFNNGKVSFYTKNDAGTEYKVTIDKSGNVVSNEKVAK